MPKEKSMEERIKALEKEIEEMKELLKFVKSYMQTKAMDSELKKKKKWLGGYPDQSEKE